MEGDLRFFVAIGQDHTYPNAASRFPNMMTFLYPGTEEEPELLCPADIDCDGLVGVTDLLALLGGWGPCSDPPPGCAADLNGDGEVGIVDLLQLLATWGPCP